MIDTLKQGRFLLALLLGLSSLALYVGFNLTPIFFNDYALGDLLAETSRQPRLSETDLRNLLDAHVAGMDARHYSLARTDHGWCIDLTYARTASVLGFRRQLTFNHRVGCGPSD